MDINEVLKLADSLIFMKTGKHLDHLQEAVLRGTVEGKTYTEIAAETYQSEGHVRNTGSELWQILSKELRQEINKSNFRSIIKKVEFNDFSAENVGHVTVNNVNFCSEATQTNKPRYKKKKGRSQPYQYLGEIPEISGFYGRQEELKILENSIFNKNSRLITILGARGIGKTTLIVQLLQQIKPQFDYIIYRSLCFSPPPEVTLRTLLEFFSKSNVANPLEANPLENQIFQLLDYLRKYRCLIVFDDLQKLFSSQKLAGDYQPELESYQRLFKLISEVNHNSCFLLISSEKPREVAAYQKKDKDDPILVLRGLQIGAAEALLKEYQLTDEESWKTLIDTYNANPMWLKLTATVIQELCGGRVAEFLQFETPVIPEALADLLNDSFKRLTDSEKAILDRLTEEEKPVTLGHLCKHMSISLTDVFNALHSLKSRFLVEAIEDEKKTFFLVNQVIREYTTRSRSHL
ncbi:ATP-binding protein [Oxynema aestuarii]|uniref:ATP-binding protein n=1 Tax=Oxynema aestuarii AP17 TaxID=2064643 RepID=A0A6H1TWS4_9CYAN|nr:ATP-binding protein [Oxynema aestuarii]QIZ69789.1 ATP-binding protein [Oxynema aestuarii AP17]